jgi:hypothetical protein
MAAPPNCLMVTGLDVVLWVQLRCRVSHHSFVLKYILSSSATFLQSIFVSTHPNMSNSHVVIPCLIISSLSLVLSVGKPPMFWKPIRKISLSFFLGVSPKLSSKNSLSPCQLSPSPSMCCCVSHEGAPLWSLTRASSSGRAAGRIQLLGCVSPGRGVEGILG